ncbi:hypothetical protein CC80DRAFT_487859 [Byssothecium circinans]|uniref:Uncharacterized protein n=1 Tax=Byssothecium circinans TaxID=147558 RepID=A0A6A5UCC1_9PLEO|nr:hypothetical protein CC80DRAFT_487859 [Byssothecium circinans]
MDWSDPWAADNDPDDNDERLPTKPTVTSVAASVTLGLGNVWDSPWGSNEDDGFGGWTSDVGKDASWGDVPNEKDAESHVRKTEDALPESNTWDRIEEDIGEHKESETSDSATTIQPDEVPASVAIEPTDSLHPDDDLSTRASTSPSDISRNETATESPRTSFEEERAAGKTAAAEPESTVHLEEALRNTEIEEAELEAKPKSNELEEADDFGDVGEGAVQDTTTDHAKVDPLEQSTPLSGSSAVEKANADESDAEAPSVPPLPTNVRPYTLDSELMSQLFPSTKDAVEPGEAPDDPIYSSSETRKAWYRLTRKETLREYNSGLDYDTYIRVTWKTSHIRSEVNKVVSRWATEDRMAGRGPGARASFYWDTSAPKDQKTQFHPRRKSTVSVSNPIGQTTQLITSELPAAFNWSSAATEAGPWKDENARRSISSPITPKHSVVAKLQREGGKRSSVDLTPRPLDPTSHKRNSSSVSSLKETAPTRSISLILPPPPKPSMNGEVNPWTGLDALDTNTPSKPEPATFKSEPTAEEDDDEDWGEMVESPAVSSTQTPLADFSEPPTRDNTLSTPATTPKSIKSSPVPAHVVSSGSKHASPIVRLKGAVSPTSALFKPNAFVPAGTEEGPIGPGILKPRNVSASSTPEKIRTPPRPVAQLDEVLGDGVAGSGSPKMKSRAEPEDGDTDDNFSALESSTPEPLSEPPKSHTPSPAPAPVSPPRPTQDPPPSWADTADFSFFESSLPTTSPPSASASASELAPAPEPAVQQPDPSDPWSIFETPAPAPAPPLDPFTRPPPRPLSPAAKQPLTGATNAAQRRKMEEDEVVRTIVGGLPDLGYMLRR